MQKQHCMIWFGLPAAIYLTAMMCICWISIVVQMTILNCYHVYPLRKIPGWLARLQACISCVVLCGPKPVGNDVVPYSDGESGHIDNSGTEDQTTNITNTDGVGVKTDSSPETNIMPYIDVITNKIQTDDVHENLRLKWKKLAKHLDRLFFIIFGIIHLLMMIIIFGAMPNM